MKLIANMVVYNEAEFVEAAIRSTIHYVDQMIIIEGAWGEFLDGNPKATERSNDGTLAILELMRREHPDKIKIVRRNSDSQLKQRDVYFEYAPKEPHIMLLQDADEVWTDEEMAKVKIISQNLPANHVVTVNSAVFINDLRHVSYVTYPRIWSLPAGTHNFVEPNRIVSNNGISNGIEYVMLPTSLMYFHYSYCHSPERFTAKKNERTMLHGGFAWRLKGNKVVREDANINEFKDKHPEIIFKYGKFKNE